MTHPISLQSDRTPPERVAFVGDVHGCVLHMLLALAHLRARRDIVITAVVQVGDLQAYPCRDRLDEPGAAFLAANPAQGDFFTLLDPPGRLAIAIGQLLEDIPGALFVSGNHEDHQWLADLHAAAGRAVVPIDPLGVFRHVACGTVLEVAGLQMAFLGRIDAPQQPDIDFDKDAYDRLLEPPSGAVDVLVTHDGPAGMSTWQGRAQGSARISRILGHLRPSLHVSGHYHHENGPRWYGPTRSYALGQLVYSRARIGDWRFGFDLNAARDNPEQRVDAGSIGLLDPATGAFEYVRDDWLAEIRGDRIDLPRHLQRMRRQ